MRDPVHNIVASYRWTPIYRTDVYWFKDEEFSRRTSYAGWGISPAWKDWAVTHSHAVDTSATTAIACAVIYNFAGDLAELEMFDHHILAAPYVVLDRPEVLAIGIGGGTDIVNALRHKARHITGVELDPVTVDVVRRDQAAFAGRIYDRPDVTVIAGEGRSTVRHSRESYDLIQLTAVDTMAALSTGAYVLSESYLYTAEAMTEFLDHLKPMACSRWSWPMRTSRWPTPDTPSASSRSSWRHWRDEASRIRSATSRSSRRLKAFRRSPVCSSQVRSRRPRCSDFQTSLPAPASGCGRCRGWLSTGALALRPDDLEGTEAFLAKAALILNATTDDNPFFFNFYRWRNLGAVSGKWTSGTLSPRGKSCSR